MKRQHHRRPRSVCAYTLLEEISASATDALPHATRVHHLTLMWQALASIERDREPKKQDLQYVSDALNIVHALVRDLHVAEDREGLLLDALQEMAITAERHAAGGSIRLSARGILCVRSILEDYAALMDQLSARVMIRAHRTAAKNVQAALAGHVAPDVKVYTI